MNHLDKLENRSVHILREAYANFRNLCMLWSIGKDSTVLLWLARKAFFGHVPFPLVHIDTHYKIPEMVEYRDRLALQWKLDMIYGEYRTTYFLVLCCGISWRSIQSFLLLSRFDASRTLIISSN
jgi:sulfate adenylyltransferase subunit 2